MNSKRVGLRCLLIAIVVALAGCATASTAFSDRLYFGRTIPGSGAEVSDAQWTAFVNEIVIPRCPEGFTVYRGTGHWRGDDGTSTSESVIVLEVVHPFDAAINRKLDEIAVEYRRRFHQEAVMRVRSPAVQSFERGR